MDRVDCVKILNEMFETIQHGDTAQNSKLALDGIVASLVGGRDDGGTGALGKRASRSCSLGMFSIASRWNCNFERHGGYSL